MDGVLVKLAYMNESKFIFFIPSLKKITIFVK